MFRHRAVRGHGGGRRRVLAAILAIGMALVFAAPAAQAEPATAPPTLTLDATPQVSGKLVARFTAEMKYDCDGMTGEALKNAIAAKNCPANGDATTNNTTVGNCGAAWIDLYDDVPYDGLGRVVWGMTSYQGVMLYRNLLINFAFTTQDQGIVLGSLADSGFVFSSTYQATGTATSPLPSGLSVILSGGVTLLTGAGCVLIPPRAIAQIT
jgi:hypothetical protein